MTTVMKKEFGLDNDQLEKYLFLAEQECGLLFSGDPALETVVEEAVLTRSPEIITTIVGEQGTGKSAFARFIGEMTCPNKSFVQCNVAGLPPTLLDSELFGHEKGSFTGAHDKRVGKLDSVRDGGTIFLDEIGELSHDGQVKMLSLLNERQYSAVGSNNSVRFRGKIVCATNCDLSTVKPEKMRKDFRSRILEQVFIIPNLDGRSEIHRRMLIDKIVMNSSTAFQMSALSIDEDAKRLLIDTSFPDNVRGLEQVIRIACTYVRNTDPTGNIREQHIRRALNNRLPIKEEAINGSAQVIDVVQISEWAKKYDVSFLEAQRYLTAYFVMQKCRTYSEAEATFGIDRNSLNKYLKNYKRLVDGHK